MIQRQTERRTETDWDRHNNWGCPWQQRCPASVVCHRAAIETSIAQRAAVALQFVNALAVPYIMIIHLDASRQISRPAKYSTRSLVEARAWSCSCHTRDEAAAAAAVATVTAGYQWQRRVLFELVLGP